jgi:hypothetical protein
MGPISDLTRPQACLFQGLLRIGYDLTITKFASTLCAPFRISGDTLLTALIGESWPASCLVGRRAPGRGRGKSARKTSRERRNRKTELPFPGTRSCRVQIHVALWRGRHSVQRSVVCGWMISSEKGDRTYRRSVRTIEPD